MKQTSYDYVIVGAGSAGCVVANRLSADPSRSVLLLEAGKSDRHPYIRIPAAFSKMFKTSRDWNYATEPEPTLADRELYVPRGKVIGGSSSINAMMYIRGNPIDFDEWAEAGCVGWSYSEVLPYFKKAEHNERLNDEYHGQGGPLNVADHPTPNPLTDSFVQACDAVGIKPTDDFNGANQTGSGYFQVNQRDGRRWSAADAYLHPAKTRKNLTVVSNAKAHRINFTNETAESVDFTVRNRRHSVSATTEIVLCAGALGSPQLLMLSGIGPADELDKLGIEPIANLPVGVGLQDHPAVPIIYDCTRPISMDDVEHPKHLLRYLTQRKGKLRSNLSEAGAFLTTRPGASAPDLQFHFGPLHFADHGFTRYDGNAFSFGPTLIDVASRGFVKLRSLDASIPLSINGNYLDQRSDIETLITGVRLGREIAAEKAFDTVRGIEVLPGSRIESDDELEDFIRRTAEMIYHPTSTCQMGTGEGSVVNPLLQVNGVDNLRVVDASIMPKIVRGNTNAATIMIAEKASDMMLTGL